MKRKLLLSIGVVSCLASISVAFFHNVDLGKTFLRTGSESYSVTLNSTAFAAAGLTTTYQDTVTQNFGNDKPVINYHLAKKDGSNNLVLAPSGKLYNYSSSATYHGRITNMTSVTVTYSGGTLYVQEGLNGDSSIYGTKTKLTSGTACNFATNPNFIMISNSISATTITRIVVTYSCSDPGFSVNRLGEKYKCKSQEGTVYPLTRNGSSISFGSYSGSISVTSSGNFTMTLSSGNLVYSGKVSSDYKTLDVISKSGSASDSAPTITELNRIYVMDDFEGYGATGKRYQTNPSHASEQNQVYVTSANSASPQSDLRAAWYSDYGGGGNNTWVVGSNFQVSTSEDYLNLTTAVKHGGSKAMTLKASTGGWMRFWNSEIFNQNQHYNYGSGNKLSFYAHGAYKNTSCTTVSSDSISLRAQVYYQNFEITDSNRNSTTYGTGTKDFTIAANSGWTEYTIDLDPNKSVYAVNFMINNSGLSANAYLPIDDISIYTSPVYVPPKMINETSTQITKSYHGEVNLSTPLGDFDYTVKIGLGSNGYIYAKAGEDMKPTKYTITGNTIVIETTGSVKGYSFGNWTGTFNSDKSVISIPKSGITGDIKRYVDNSTVYLYEDTKLVDGSESTSTLQSILVRQYKDGSWQTDSTSSDRITQNNMYYIQGNSSIRVNPYSSGQMRVYINPSLAQSMSANISSVSFWFYAPAGITYNYAIYGYKDYTPSSTSGRYQQMYTYTCNGTSEAGWNYINMGIESGFGKNIAIWINTNSAQTILDYITYF